MAPSRGLPRALAAALAALLLGGLGPSAAARAQERQEPPAGEPSAWEVLDQRAAEGQQCIVCRLPVHEGDVVEVRHKGRRFFVSARMLEQFAADPDRFFHELEAHGGLFDEAAMETPPMQTGWLWLGLYILVGLVAGAACSYVALDRGLPARGWFFAGLSLNVLALAAVLTRGRRAGPLAEPPPAGLAKIPTTHAPVACARCGGGNHPAAAACSACGQALSPTIEPEAART